jgi:hypothetical protein
MKENANWFDNYHTYGLMTTTSGSWPMESCSYVDHVLMNCIQFPGGPAWLCSNSGNDGNSAPAASNGSGCYGQRNEIYWQVGSYGDQMAGDVHVYVQSIRMWSCPAWNAGGKPNVSVPGINTCYGTVIAGENLKNGPKQKMWVSTQPQLWSPASGLLNRYWYALGKSVRAFLKAFDPMDVGSQHGFPEIVR